METDERTRVQDIIIGTLRRRSTLGEAAIRIIVSEILADLESNEFQVTSTVPVVPENDNGVREGQVWQDKDKRGGPTFTILSIEGEHARVANVDMPFRERKIKLARLPQDYRRVEVSSPS